MLLQIWPFYATWAPSYRRRKLREAGNWTTLPWYWETTWLMWSPLSQQQTLKEWCPLRDSSPVVVDITLKQQTKPLEVYYVLYEGYKDLIKVQARPSYILYTALESITGQHSHNPVLIIFHKQNHIRLMWIEQIYSNCTFWLLIHFFTAAWKMYKVQIKTLWYVCFWKLLYYIVYIYFYITIVSPMSVRASVFICPCLY